MWAEISFHNNASVLGGVLTALLCVLQEPVEAATPEPKRNPPAADAAEDSSPDIALPRFGLWVRSHWRSDCFPAADDLSSLLKLC